MLDLATLFDCLLGVVVSGESASIYRFQAFEFDVRAAELRKNGVRLKLQDQSSQVLLKLLERPGEVVSREELRSTLWPDNTFVDFETGLNTVIKRLRETLGDSADNPTFIETVPRRGYKFIAAVELRPIHDNGLTGTQSRLRRVALLSIGVTAGVVALVLTSLAVWGKRPQPSVVNLVQITNDGRAKIPINSTFTDGVHLYFIEGTPWTSGSRIAQMSVQGGETTSITTSLRNPLAIASISPDRSELLVEAGVAVGADLATGRSDFAAELWVQPLPAGAPHRVGTFFASAGTWTPDGTHLVYANDNGIMIANRDGSDPQQLAKVSGVVRALRFSPDGRRIRFFVIRKWEESSSIWEMDVNGAHLHPLLPDWKESPYQCCGSWSPDGDYYYFQAGRGSTQALWVLRERVSIFQRGAPVPFRLTFGPLRFGGPIPSSDGKKLFVVGEEPRVELFRYDLKARRFDPYLTGFSAGPVDFSPDRKWMAYVSYPDMTLWRSRLDGSDKMQLTFSPVRAYLPRWSPDGSRIVFMDVQFYRPWRIAMVSSSGGPELPLQDGDEGGEVDPTWTPDGESIVFAKSGKNGPVAIYRFDLKTRKVASVPGSDGLFSPRVSPDGRYITALTSSQRQLMVFNTNSNRWSSVMGGEQLGYNEWSRDGKYIYLRENRGGAGEIVRVSMKDHTSEQVLDLKDFPQLQDVFTAWIGLTPDDALLLMRDRSVQELYALDLRFH